jgi:hypothetical protein
MPKISKFTKEQKKKICKKTGKCQYCPYHGGENKGRQPKPDKHKNKR